MNKQIQELALQAGYKDLPTVRLAFQGFNKEKFAELLIREAAQFVSESSEVYTQAEQDACVRAAIGLKKYFGVEE